MDFTTVRDKYLDYTHRLNDYNEISNINDYLLKSNTIEESRLKAMSDMLSTKVLKMKQEYMASENGIHEYRLRINILYLSIVISCAALVAAAYFSMQKLSKNMLFVVSATLLVIYLVLVLIIIAMNKNRRKYAWNQYYWDPMKKKT